MLTWLKHWQLRCPPRVSTKNVFVNNVSEAGQTATWVVIIMLSWLALIAKRCIYNSFHRLQLEEVNIYSWSQAALDYLLKYRLLQTKLWPLLRDLQKSFWIGLNHSSYNSIRQFLSTIISPKSGWCFTYTSAFTYGSQSLQRCQPLGRVGAVCPVSQCDFKISSPPVGSNNTV